MAEIQRVEYHKIRIIVKSRRVYSYADNATVTRYYAEIRNRTNNVALYATDPTVETPAEALEDAKAFLDHGRDASPQYEEIW
jgi:hypothetical protein